MTREEIINKAKEIVASKPEQYGQPEDSFQRIAKYWSIYLDKTIDAKDVASMMVLFKVARIHHSPYKDDHYIDICGYAACGGELADKQLDDFIEDLEVGNRKSYIKTFDK